MKITRPMVDYNCYFSLTLFSSYPCINIFKALSHIDEQPRLQLACTCEYDLSQIRLN